MCEEMKLKNDHTGKKDSDIPAGKETSVSSPIYRERDERK